MWCDVFWWIWTILKDFSKLRLVEDFFCYGDFIIILIHFGNKHRLTYDSTWHMTQHDAPGHNMLHGLEMKIAYDKWQKVGNSRFTGRRRLPRKSHAASVTINWQWFSSNFQKLMSYFALAAIFALLWDYTLVSSLLFINASKAWRVIVQKH